MSTTVELTAAQAEIRKLRAERDALAAAAKHAVALVRELQSHGGEYTDPWMLSGQTLDLVCRALTGGEDSGGER